MKTILFSTDFSSNSIHAAQYAGMLANKLEANIVLLNVYSIIVPLPSEYQLTYGTENSMVIQENEAKESLKLFTEKFIGSTNLPPERVIQRVEYGMVTEVIVETAKSINADFIVMGTKGASNMFDKWLGTTAEKVMEAAECPVWIIPQNASLDFPRVIMYAADFKEHEIAATHKVVEIAKPLGASCKVIHIHDYYTGIEDFVAKERISDLKNEFKEEDISFKDLNREEIVKGLENYINNYKPDVLALATYEKSFLSKLFLSSITEHFVLEAKLPMLIFKK